MLVFVRFVVRKAYNRTLTAPRSSAQCVLKVALRAGSAPVGSTNGGGDALTRYEHVDVASARIIAWLWPTGESERCVSCMGYVPFCRRAPRTSKQPTVSLHRRHVGRTLRFGGARDCAGGAQGGWDG